MNNLVIKKYGLPLLLLLVFAGLFFHAPSAKAGLFTIPWTISGEQLNATDWMDWLPRIMFTMIVLAGEFSVFAATGGLMLDWASQQSVDLNNNLVTYGWNFVSGLTNIIFILIFIAIAFSYILKVESFQIKKALPRLIIIALLVNFSLLFVKMITDVGWITQNSFKDAFFVNGSLTASLLAPLTQGLLKVIVGLGTGLIAYGFLGIIPFANWGVMVGIITAMIGEAFFGVFSYAVLFIIFTFIIGLIFWVYSFLFFARIAVIWLLAIISPLALAAYILPSTEKFFKQWLHYLISWTFLGVIMFFLLGLGIRLFSALFPAATPFSLSGPAFNFSQYYTRFIFLIVYLVVSLYASIKLSPKGTEIVWKVAGAAAVGGAGFVAIQSRRRGMEADVWRLEKKQKEERRIQELQTKSTSRHGLTSTETQELQKLQNWRNRTLRRVTGWTTAGTPPAAIEAKATQLKSALVQDQKKNLLAKTKNMDDEGAKAFLRSELENHKRTGPEALRNKYKTAALYELMADKGALEDKDMDFYMEAWKTAGPEAVKDNPVKKAVIKKYPHWGTYNERKDYYKKMKSSDIDKWDRSAQENDAVVKEIVNTRRADFITRLGSQTAVSSQKIQVEFDKTIGQEFRNLVKGITDISKLDMDERRRLMRGLEVIRHLHLSPSPEVQTWKKYGTMEKGKPDSIDDMREALRKLIK